MEAKPKTSPGIGLAIRLVIICVVAAVVPLIVSTVLVAGTNADFLGSVSLFQLAIVLVGAALFAAGLGVVQANRISRPLRQLQRGLRHVAVADYSRQLSSDTTGELAFLIDEYNQMLTRLGRLQGEWEQEFREISLALHHRTDELNARVVDNARLRAEAQQQVKSVSSLREFSHSMTASSGVGRICGQLLDTLQDQVHFEVGYVLLSDENSPKNIPLALLDKKRNLRLAGQYVKDLPAIQSLPGKNMAPQVIRSASALRSAEQCVNKEGGEETRLHILGVPVRTNNRTIGAIILAAPRPKAYSRQDERATATLAAQAALAIENIRLLEETGKLEALREVDRLKSELISTVSHELRTPLASIKGYISTLLRPDVDWGDESRAEFLQIIEEESDRLQALIDNLLQMSRIDAGVLRIDKQPTQITRLAHRVARKARLRSTEHRFSLLFPNDMPDVELDVAQIELVLGNLVDNAIKYSPRGRVTIRGQIVGSNLKVSVSDEGIGISQQHLERIFERFYRAETPEIKRISGTGLGLSICRGIVEAHGGKMYAESRPGEGSTFSFEVPLGTVAADGVPAELCLAATVGGEGYEQSGSQN